MSKKKYKQKSKYLCKIKVDKLGTIIWLHSNDLLSLTRYLDYKYIGWCWFNILDNDSKKQIANFTNKNRPLSKKI